MQKITQHRAALITGASGGIGYELAKILAQEKHNLVLVARNRKKLLQIRKELEEAHKVSIWIVAKDLTAPGAAREVMNVLLRKKIEIDVLVNNAGFGDFGYFHSASWDKLHSMIELNITVLTEMTHLFLPSMIARARGHILNVASTAGFQPGPLMAVYYATKAYVISFSTAIAEEAKDHGVAVTALCPGPTHSGFQKAAGLDHSRLFSLLPVATSADVARFGYKAMMKGDLIAIHGLLNRMGAFSVRFAPMRVILAVVRAIQNLRR